MNSVTATKAPKIEMLSQGSPGDGARGFEAEHQRATSSAVGRSRLELLADLRGDRVELRLA